MFPRAFFAVNFSQNILALCDANFERPKCNTCHYGTMGKTIQNISDFIYNCRGNIRSSSGEIRKGKEMYVL